MSLWKQCLYSVSFCQFTTKAMPLILSLLLAGACSSRKNNEEGSETQVVGGLPVQDGEFPGLLEIVSMSCTGTKIGPRHVLTARHCAQKFVAGEKMRIRTGVKDDPARYREVEIAKLTHHQLSGVSNSEQDKLNIDLALLEVKNGLEGITTASLHAAALRDGQRVFFVGYGCTSRASGSFSGGAANAATGGSEFTSHGDSAVRRAPTKLDCLVRVSDARLTQTNAMCSFGPATVLRPAEVTPGLCPGDSGGPLYVNSGSASRPNYKIAGVNSNFHIAGDSRFARVDPGAAAVNAWIRSALR